VRRVQQVLQAEGLVSAPHEDPQERATVHVSRVRQAIPRLWRTQSSPEGRAREAEELHVRPVRPLVRFEGDAGGSSTHAYWRTALRLRFVRQDVQVQGLVVHSQQAAHGRVPARVLVLRQTIPPPTGSAGPRDHAHRREESRVRRVREEVPRQVRAGATQAHPLRGEAVRVRQVRPGLPAEALPEQSQQEPAQRVPACALTVKVRPSRARIRTAGRAPSRKADSKLVAFFVFPGAAREKLSWHTVRRVSPLTGRIAS